jgi:predicted nucleotidyltransferase
MGSNPEDAMDRLTVLRKKRQEVLAIATRYGAKNLRVFGSVARGGAKPDSDIDFLVEFEPGHGFLAHAALIRELEGLLASKVDVVSQNGLKQRIRSDVLREAVPL